MQVLIDVTVPVFLLIGGGYITARFRLLSNSDIDGLMKFAQGVAIPCLMFRAISQLDFQASFSPLLMLSFYSGSVIIFLMATLGARLLVGRSMEDAIAIGFAAMFGNTVLTGLAIIGRAYGGATLQSTYLLVAFHAPFCYLVGITAMEIARSKDPQLSKMIAAVAEGMFRSPIMLGIAAGFLFNVLAIPVPGLAGDMLDMLKVTALPAALFGLGGILVQYRPEGDLAVIGMVCLLTLIVHPLISWIMSFLVFGLDQTLVRSAVVTAAMAPGINAFIFANIYGRAKRVAASSVLIGTAASILTASFWILVAG